jgi:hypothetical protein
MTTEGKACLAISSELRLADFFGLLEVQLEGTPSFA